jgi:GNAT superfamily N-acetyltransferase
MKWSEIINEHVEMVKVGERFGKPRGHVTAVTVNPTISDLARLLAASSRENYAQSQYWSRALRVLATSQDVAAWDSNDGPHTAIGRALPEFKGMRPDYYIIKIVTPDKAQYQIGRFPVIVYGRHGSRLGKNEVIQPVLAKLLGPSIAANERLDSAADDTKYLVEIICENAFDLKDVVIRQSGDSFVAYWNDQKIGYVTLDMYDKSVAPDARHIHKSGVWNGFRRKGVATRLYAAAADWLQRDGLRLVPSPEGILSDEALAFWKRCDPAALSKDSRLNPSPYLNKTITYKGDDWSIYRVGAKFAHIRKTDGSEITALIPKTTLTSYLS